MTENQKITSIYDALVGTLDKPGLLEKVSKLEKKIDHIEEQVKKEITRRRKYLWSYLTTITLALLSLLGTIYLHLIK